MQAFKTHASQIRVVMCCAIFAFALTYFVLDLCFEQKPAAAQTVSISFLPHQVSLLQVVPVDTIPASQPLGNKVPDISRHEVLFHLNPPLLLWSMVILILMSIAAGAGPLFLFEIKEMAGKFKLGLQEIGLAFLSSVALMILMALASLIHKGFLLPDEVVNKFHILFKHGELLKWIVGITLLLSLPEGTLIFLIGYASDKLMSEVDTVNPGKRDFELLAQKFDSLNKALAYGVQVLAVIVALTVLSLMVLGAAINNVITVTGFNVFPDAISVVYGLMLSLFLGILYVPTFLMLGNQNRELRRMLERYQDANPGKDEEWAKGISDLIDMKSPGKDNLKLAFTILLPLVTSLVPQLKHFSFS